MHVVRNPKQNIQQRVVRRKMHLASERMVVNGVGLGEVDGLFNIGKMFSRLVHVTPRSFQLKNIMGAIGSATMFTATGGLSSLAPKLTGAHSSLSKGVGIATTAVAAAAGAIVAAPAIGASLGIGGTAATGTGLTTVAGEGSMMAAGSGVLAPVEGTIAPFISTGLPAGGGVLAPAGEVASGGFLSTIGSGISSIGSGILKALPAIGKIFGGGGGTQVVQQQPQYDPYTQGYINQQQQIQQQTQQSYEDQVRAQQAQLYTAGGFNPNIPYVASQYSGPASMNTSYGDLRSPYTAVTEDGTQVQVDPRTGQVVEASMFPDLSATTWLAIGAATLVGWYFMSESESKSNN